MAGWRIFVDTGGTFTDALAVDPEGNLSRCKVLSRSCLRCRIVGKGEHGEWILDADWKLPDGFFTGYEMIDERNHSFPIIAHTANPHQVTVRGDHTG